MQYPMVGGMTLQGLSQTVPVVAPLSGGPQHQPNGQAENPNDAAIRQKLDDQERKLAERQAEMAQLAEKLATLKNQQMKSIEQQQQQEQVEQQLRQQQQQRVNNYPRQERQNLYNDQEQEYQAAQSVEHQRHAQTTRSFQRPTTSWNLSNGTEYSSNKPTRTSSNFLLPDHTNSFLEPESDVLPPSEFRDRHPPPPLQPNYNTSISAASPKAKAHGNYVDGPVLRSNPEGTASVVLALHSKKPAPHVPNKVFHIPNYGDRATTSFTVVMTEKSGRTELYRKSAGPYLTYQNVKWKLFLRKEVRPVHLFCNR